MKAGIHHFSFLLIALLLIKVSAFHIYEEHDTLEDSGEKCELCLMAVESLQLDGTDPGVVDVPRAEVAVFQGLSQIFARQSFARKGETLLLFSRPPPASRV